MRYGILGPLELIGADGSPVEVRGTRARALLCALLLQRGRVASVDRLTDAVWGEDPPSQPANALQARVGQLRRTLAEGSAAGVLETRPPGYVLRLAPGELDAEVFEQKLTAARASPADGPVDAAELLREALGLWRGDALADVVGEPFAQPEAARLEELRLVALEECMEVELRLSRHESVVGELHALVAEHPLRERLRGLLMIALYRCGRQAEALATFDAGREAFVEQLGLDPGPSLERLRDAVLRQDPALLLETPPEPPEGSSGPPEGPRQAPAPPVGYRANRQARLTSFVGRTVELGEVEVTLADARLVTLTGPGGVGKTRLAREIGSVVLERFPDGVWLVELAGVADQAAVAPAVASTLEPCTGEGPMASSGAEPMIDRVVQQLRACELLLVLDNCEHLLEGVARLADVLLSGCPGVRVLATSREPLGVRGEVVLPIAPLELPAPGFHEPGAVGDVAAIELFVDRARAADPSFELSETSVGAVTDICRRLDGLPLAIELAAARVRALPVHQLATRLDDRFRVLTAGSRIAMPRQRTLRAAVDWSYDLLDDAEQRVFERLSVFAGGFTLEAAEAVCGGGDVERGDVVDLVARLVDKSLLAPPEGPGARYRMLETLRHYAREQLAEAGRLQETLQRHAHFFVTLAERESSTPGRRDWLDRLDTDHDNLRAALQWTIATGRDDDAQRLAFALTYFWLLHADIEEGARWLATAAAVTTEPTVARARALGGAGLLAAWAGNLEQAVEFCRHSLEIHRQHDDPWGAGRSFGAAATAAGMLGQLDRVGGYLDQAEAALERANDRWGLSICGLLRAMLAQALLDHDGADEAATRALDGFTQIGDAWGATQALGLLGGLAIASGDLQQASKRYEAALDHARQLSLRPMTGALLCQLAYLAIRQGDLERARGLYEQNLTDAHQQGRRDAIVFALNALGLVARHQGDLPEAERLHQQALDSCGQLAHEARRALTLSYLGFVAEQRGDPTASQQLHTQALATAADDRLVTACALTGLAGAAAAAGDARRAARLLGAAETTREATAREIPLISFAAARRHLSGGAVLPPAEHLDLRRIERTVREALAPEHLADALARGRTLQVTDLLEEEQASSTLAVRSPSWT